MSSFTLPTVPLGKSNLRVGKVAHGLMMMTWKEPNVDDETAFASIKAGLDLVKSGEKIFLNTGEFYGVNPPVANLRLLARFFKKYPTYRERAFISVKGGFNIEMAPDSSYDSLRKSVLNISKELGGTKFDLYQPARIDGIRPIEEIVTDLAKLRDEGLFDYIGLSEVNASTLRRAAGAAEIAAVEVEVSPTNYPQEIKDLIVAAKELSVNVIAYSPLGRGLLAGVVTAPLDPSDIRSHTPQFQKGALEKNQEVVAQWDKAATKKGVTKAQLCIAWVGSRGDHVIPLPGSSKESRTLENFASANIILSEKEKQELDQIIQEFKVAGDRYPDFLKPYLML